MKKIMCMMLAASLIFCCIFTGCAGNSSAPDNTDGTVTVVDHNGYTVTLPENIERIAVCDFFPLPSVLAIFFDSADKIVAMSPSSMSAAKNGLLSELYPEILNVNTSAVSGTDVNTEELMKLDPQVVFYSSGNPQLGETLRKSGFNAVAMSADKWGYNAVETLNQWIDLLSQIFPESANGRAELVREYSENAMALVSERIEKLTDEEREKVFFLFQYDENAIVTSGRRFFGQWWADAIGAVNAGEELDENNSVKVTLEQVYSWNPDTILMTNYTTSLPENLYNNSVGSYDWSGISAVAQHKVYKMPLGMYRSYTAGVDTPITLLWLAKTVYPELFEDIDITEKVIEYYETVFGIHLTAEQAESIFSPAGDAGKIDI